MSMPAPAFIASPAVVLPPEQYTTAEIISHLRDVHAGQPGLEDVLRAAVETGVETRHFTRPLHTRTRDMTTEEARVGAYQDALALALVAGQKALDTLAVSPDTIDCLIASHATPGALPNFVAELVGSLHLRRTVRTISFAGPGSAGGLLALSAAEEHISAHPDALVLVVAAECLSAAAYDAKEKTSTVDMVLFGDAAAATVVSGMQLTPGLRLDTLLDYVQPEAEPAQFTDGRTGLFDAEDSAAGSVDACMPPLLDWLTPDRLPAFAVAHPGSSAMLHAVSAGLGPATDLRWSRSSLRTIGNIGSPGVLEALARVHDDPPSNGARGLLLAHGPGIIMAAGTGEWIA
jgi:predicted naringenin-chalcone synthase